MLGSDGTIVRIGCPDFEDYIGRVDIARDRLHGNTSALRDCPTAVLDGEETNDAIHMLAFGSAIRSSDLGGGHGCAWRDASSGRNTPLRVDSTHFANPKPLSRQDRAIAHQCIAGSVYSMRAMLTGVDWDDESRTQRLRKLQERKS